MKGSEIVAALKGIVNMTSLNTISTEDKVAIRSLLDIINLCLFTPTCQVNAYQRPYYQLRVSRERSQRHLRRSQQDSVGDQREHHRIRSSPLSLPSEQGAKESFASHEGI